MNESKLLLAIAGYAMVALVSGARADVIGFGDFSSKWRFQQFDSSPPLQPTGNGIRLTTSTGGNQARNYYHTERQDVSRFVATFDYRAGRAPTNQETGLSFVLFGSDLAMDGVTRSGGNNAQFGYQGIFSGPPSTANRLTRSMALCLSLPGTVTSVVSGYGLYTGGSIGGSFAPTAPVTFAAAGGVRVRMTYNQAGQLSNFVYVTLTDLASGAVFAPEPFFLNVPTALATSSGFVGFTTAVSSTEQVITNFSFVSVPTPGAGLAMPLGLWLSARRRR